MELALKEYFSGNNLELLLKQLNNYSLNVSSIEIKNPKISYSYIKGASMIMDNVLELYNKAKNSSFGSAKIYALNMTVNKKVLADFFKGLKEDLGITEKIFQGGSLDIPLSKKIMDNIILKYEKEKMHPEAYIFGAKKLAKVIDYAYNAPLTAPFKDYIIKESESIVKNISYNLNNVIYRE